MEVTYRLRRFYRNLGIGGLILWSSLAVLGVYGALTDGQVRDPVGLAMLVGGLALFMGAISALLIASYYRRSLILRGKRIELAGILWSREIDLGDVTQAKWLPRWLVLRDESTRLSIELGEWDWTDGDRDALIGLVRSAVDREVQSGWDLFAFKRGYGLPRRPPGEVGKDEVLITRRRWAFYCLPLAILAGLGGVVAWRILGQPRFLLAPLFPPLLWGSMHYSTPADGVAVPRLRRQSGSGVERFLLFLFVWGMLGVATLLVGFRLTREHRPAVIILFLVIWMGGLLYAAHQQDRRKACHDREAAELAAKARGERSGAAIRLSE